MRVSMNVGCGILNAVIATLLLVCTLSAQTNIPELEGPSDYRARTIYFLLTDRFHPHLPYAPYIDPLYPDATNSVDCFATACTEEEQFRKYWGGDIQGVIEKLDYLKELGISAVWFTPLMENVRMYSQKGYGTGYHGYWIQNYYRVNEHFGNWNDVNELSKQLHSKGMRYMQDITLNHSNPSTSHVYGRLFESTEPNQVFIKSYYDDFDLLNRARYYKHWQWTQACKAAASEADYEWTYWQLHHCLLADLSGYNQHDPAVADYLLGAGKIWLENGVDDWRLDAVKFPFPDFIAKFTQTVRDYLQSQHRPVPYIVGEWSHGGVGDAKSLRFANEYNIFGTNILDFTLSYRLNAFIEGKAAYSADQFSASQLDQLLHQRVVDLNGRDSWMGTFIDNHDQIRTMVRLNKLSITDEQEREHRMDLATVLLLTVRGVPIIYYGDEQYLAHYDDNQNTAPEYVNTGDDDPWNRPGLTSFDETTPAFRIIRTLARLRKTSPAIWRGEYVTVYADDDVLVFERIYKGESVLVAVNRGEEKTISLTGHLGFKPGEYTGLLENASDVNYGNYLSVARRGATLHLNKLSSLVIR